MGTDTDEKICMVRQACLSQAEKKPKN